MILDTLVNAFKIITRVKKLPLENTFNKCQSSGCFFYLHLIVKEMISSLSVGPIPIPDDCHISYLKLIFKF